MSIIQVRDPGRIGWGLVIIAFGLLLLADRYERLDFTFSGEFWPFILIALGVGRLLQAPDPAVGRVHRSGWGLLAVGLWALAVELNLWGLRYDNAWPLLLIGFGLSLVWRARSGHPMCGGGPRRGAHAA
jgi:hypothetical protein